MFYRRLWILAQYAVLIALIGWGGHYLLKPKPQPEYDPAEWHAWGGVSIISYGGVAKNKEDARYPSPDQLEDHLNALAGAGYKSVTPRDVVRFLEGEAPLPEKALMIIFEGGRKDSFIRATPILRRTGFIAVMGVFSSHTGQFDRFHLRKGELRKAAELAHWRFGSMGHEAGKHIDIDESGETAPFLVARAYRDGRKESAAEYQKRVSQDIAASWNTLKKATREPVRVFIYPYADAGTSANADAVAPGLLRDAVRAYFDIAISRNAGSWNSAFADRYALTRTRIGGALTGAELVERLEQYKTRPSLKDWRNPDRWLIEGSSSWKDGALTLEEGAVAWFIGSEDWSDFEVEVGLEPAENSMAALYGRYRDPESYFRVTTDGRMHQTQERLDGKTYNLENLTHTGDSRESTRAVRMLARGNRLRVWVDGRSVGGAPIPLSAGTRRGAIGVQCMRGAMRVTAMRGGVIPHAAAAVDSLRDVTEESLAGVRAVAPRWFVPGRPWEDIRIREEDPALNLASVGFEVVPRIDIGSGTGEAERQVLDMLSDPVYAKIIRKVVLEGFDEDLVRALEKQGLWVICRLPWTRAETLLERIESLECGLWIDGDPAGEDLHAVLNEIPSYRLWLSGDKPPRERMVHVLEVNP